MSLLRTAIGRVLRRIRQAQGRTLQDVADRAGVSMAYLSEVERGRKEASSEMLAAICGALGIDLIELLDEVRSELTRAVPYAMSRSAVGRGAGAPRAFEARLVTCSRTRIPSFTTSF
jgi:transcriptional regulator with XRE-family HTH domain